MDSDGAFAELVVAQGIAKREQVAECLAELARLRDAGKPVPTLGELLVRRGYLTVESLKTVGAIEAAPVTDLPPDAQKAAADPANLLGRYVRVAMLGRGGMGEVWRAWDRDLARWVALKFLHEKAVIDRFRQEAQTSARLNHPNIAAVYEVSEHGGVPFIAMQFVKGRPLSEFARKDARAAAEMLRDAALAVHHAHEQGVIHRDLKPGNIMVEDGTRRVYVLDFGLARRTDVKGPMSVTGVAIGTPAYMPPEQAAGERADERSDVYGLGATLYHLLTARAPVDGDQVLDILIKVLEGDVTPPRALDTGIDVDLETIVLTAMAPEPERRYASAKALADDLQRWLDGDAISARPASIAYRARKYLGRRKAKVAAGLLAMLLAGAVGIYWFGIRPGTAALALEAEVFGPIRRQLAELPPTVEGLRRSLELVDTGLTTCPASWDAWMLKGDLHERLNDADRALEAYRRAFALNPKLGAARYRAGRVLMDLKGDPEGGAREFAEALKVDPDNEFALLGVARQAILAEKWADAWAALDRAEAAGKYLGELHRLRGLLHQKPQAGRHDLAKALESYRKALALDPMDLTAYYNRGILRSGEARRLAGRGRNAEAVAGFDDAIRDYGQAIAIWPGAVEAWFNRVSARHWKAEALDVLGRRADALLERRTGLAEAARSIELAPRRADGYGGRGLLRDDLGDLDGAYEDYSKAIELAPNDGDAWANRGSLRERRADALAKAGRKDEAREERLGALADYDRAVELAKDKALTLTNRGGVRRRLGDAAGAMEDLEAAVKLAPETAELWANLGAARSEEAQARCDVGRLEEALALADRAIEDFDRAILLNASLAASWSNRARMRAMKGDALAKLGRREEATRWWREALPDIVKAIGLGMAGADALYQKARLTSLLGDDVAAIEGYTEALKADPAHAHAAYNRGCLWRKQRQHTKAVEDFTRTVEADAGFHDAWVNRAVTLTELAVAYEDAGRADLAKKARSTAMDDYGRALALRPRERLTYFNRGVLNAQRREFAAAIRDFTSALEIDPDDLGALANRAASKLASGDYAGAEADAELTLTKAPASWPSRKAVERIRDEARRGK